MSVQSVFAVEVVTCLGGPGKVLVAPVERPPGEEEALVIAEGGVANCH